MIVNIEREFKSLLDKNEFENILCKYSFKKKIQTNFYYDTKDYYLFRNDITIKIREYENKEKSLQVKGPKDKTKKYSKRVEYKEKTDTLPMILTLKNIDKKLLEFISEDISIKLLGNLVTERYWIERNGVVIYLDKNLYLNNIDYEIEIEFSNIKCLNKELKELGIKFNHVPNGKYSRFLKKRRELLNETSY